MFSGEKLARYALALIVAVWAFTWYTDLPTDLAYNLDGSVPRSSSSSSTATITTQQQSVQSTIDLWKNPGGDGTWPGTPLGPQITKSGSQRQGAVRVGAVKIAIVTGYFGQYSSFKSVTLMNKKEYANKHGYAFLDVTDSVETDQEDKRWAKVEAIQKSLSDADWVFWSGPTSFILNMSRPLEDFLDSRYNLIISAGSPKSDHSRGMVSTGSFFVQRSQVSGTLLQHWKELPTLETKPKELFPEGFNNHWYFWAEDKCCLFGDRGGLMYLLHWKPELAKTVKYVGYRDFNSLAPCFGEGDFSLHFSDPKVVPDNIQAVISAVTDWDSGLFDATKIPNHDVSKKRCDSILHSRGLDYTELNPLDQ